MDQGSRQMTRITKPTGTGPTWTAGTTGCGGELRVSWSLKASVPSSAMAREKQVPMSVVKKARQVLDIDPEQSNPYFS